MRTIQDMIFAEVRYCVSGLVATLAQGVGRDRQHGHDTLMDMSEQAQELAAPVLDYESAAREAGWNQDEDGRWRHEDGLMGSLKSAAKVCEHFVEPHEHEVYEHWAVSDWLADKLEAHGEKVDRNFAGMTIWARTTTGQAIYADGVINRIYGEMMAV